MGKAGQDDRPVFGLAFNEEPYVRQVRISVQIFGRVQSDAGNFRIVQQLLPHLAGPGEQDVTQQGIICLRIHGPLFERCEYRILDHVAAIDEGEDGISCQRAR